MEHHSVGDGPSFFRLHHDMYLRLGKLVRCCARARCWPEMARSLAAAAGCVALMHGARWRPTADCAGWLCAAREDRLLASQLTDQQRAWPPGSSASSPASCPCPWPCPYLSLSHAPPSHAPLGTAPPAPANIQSPHRQIVRTAPGSAVSFSLAKPRMLLCPLFWRRLQALGSS